MQIQKLEVHAVARGAPVAGERGLVGVHPEQAHLLIRVLAEELLQLDRHVCRLDSGEFAHARELVQLLGEDPIAHA